MAEISFAERKDIPFIFQIAEPWKITNVENEDDGFLVSDFSVEDYVRSFEAGNAFFKATVDGEIVAFLYGYYSEDIAPSDIVNSLVRTNMKDRFFVVKQICTKMGDEKARGATSKLYDHVKGLGIPVIASIVLEPLNERSVAFHEKKGFKKILEIDAPEDFDGKKRARGVWAYFPEGFEASIRTLAV